PLSSRLHTTPYLADALLQAQVAVTLAASLPIVALPLNFQVPTRHWMASTGLGSVSAVARAGTSRAHAVISLFMIVSLPTWRSIARYGVPSRGNSSGWTRDHPTRARSTCTCTYTRIVQRIGPTTWVVHCAMWFDVVTSWNGSANATKLGS